MYHHVSKAHSHGKHPGGRPRIDFNLEEVEKLGVIHAATPELAAYFNVDDETITLRMQSDPEFLAAYKKGMMKGKASLRRKQIELAQGGNVAMLIWLGKQILDQADVPQNIISVAANAVGNVTNVTDDARRHLIELQRAVLAEAKRFELPSNPGSRENTEGEDTRGGGTEG